MSMARVYELLKIHKELCRKDVEELLNESNSRHVNKLMSGVAKLSDVTEEYRLVPKWKDVRGGMPKMINVRFICLKRD